MITLPKIILSILVAIFVGVGLAAFGIDVRDEFFLFCVLALILNAIIQPFIFMEADE